jgi:hypothetical protein
MESPQRDWRFVTMSFLEKRAKAAVFFVLGVMVSGIVVGTTLYADAQFGAARFRRFPDGSENPQHGRGRNSSIYGNVR